MGAAHPPQCPLPWLEPPVPTGTSGDPAPKPTSATSIPNSDSEHDPQTTTGPEPDLRGNKPRPEEQQDDLQGTQFSVGVLGTHGSPAGPAGGVHPTAKLLI